MERYTQTGGVRGETGRGKVEESETKSEQEAEIDFSPSEILELAAALAPANVFSGLQLRL